MDRLDSQELILHLCGFIETCVYWILTKVELHVNITGTSFLRFQLLRTFIQNKTFSSLSQGGTPVFFNNPGNSCMLLLLLSRFSRVRLYATPETAAHQAPQSLGFSRQEHWSGLPFPSPMHESEK